MEEYRDTVTVIKRGAREETIRINRLMKYPIADVVLSKMTAGDIQNFIDTRGSEKSKTGEQISPVTVIREYCHIIGVLNHAVRKGILLKSPAVGIRLSKKPEHRERVATEEIIQKLMAAVGWDGVSAPENLIQFVILAFVLSCRTGIGAGEILSTCW